MCTTVTRRLPRHGNSIRRPGEAVCERRREEERLPPSPFSPFPRQTCGEAAELSRGHTTHIASAPIHPMRRLKIAHPHPHPPPASSRLSLALLRLHVNFSPGCHLPTQSSISLSACLAGGINGLSLQQVLIPLQCYKAVEPPDWNPLFTSASRVSLKACFCTRPFGPGRMRAKPQGRLKCGC